MDSGIGCGSPNKVGELCNLVSSLDTACCGTTAYVGKLTKWEVNLGKKLYIIHWMFSSFSGFPLLGALFGYSKQTYNILIYPGRFRKTKWKDKSGKIKPHLLSIRANEGICCLLLGTRTSIWHGIQQATSSITFLSGRKGAWEAYFTQLITHQHHSSVWENWILCPGV